MCYSNSRRRLTLNISIMKKVLFFLIALLAFISCRNDENIKNAVLDVCLGDTRAECKDKLDKQGYKWKEDNSFMSSIAISEPVVVDGCLFDNVEYMMFDAKVVLIFLNIKSDSEEMAIKDFSEIDKKINEKYARFRTSNTNDQCLKYAEYDDGITHLTVILYHHPEEEVPELFRDAETLEMAKESWEVSVGYKLVGKGYKENNAF